MSIFLFDKSKTQYSALLFRQILERHSGLPYKKSSKRSILFIFDLQNDKSHNRGAFKLPKSTPKNHHLGVWWQTFN